MGFPQADTRNYGYNHLGKLVNLTASPLYQPKDLDHSAAGFVRQYDGGRMDGFDLKEPSGTLAYQYTQQSDIVPYWTIAQQYTIADRMFESNNGPSFGAHQFLVAGQTGFNDNPPGHPWGCDGLPPECFTYRTLADSMDAAGVKWKYYASGGAARNPKNISVWLAYDANSQIRYGPDWTNGDIADTSKFFSDVANGTLAQVSWIIPAGSNSDHPGNRGGADTGPAWVASLVNQIGNSAYWNDTAIFITWDDWGGWYDHVAPQEIYSDGLGFRVPLLVVSPYSKHGVVSHINHEFGSILHYTEGVFGLPSLGTADARADDLSDCFDYTQAPKPFQPIPARILAPSTDNSPPDSY
jgi:phospholipase C